jgi:acetamidase/formamidase
MIRRPRARASSAVEGATNVVLVVELLKTPGPAWPRIENDVYLAVVGSSRPLEDAWRAGQVDMVGWLGELYGLDKLDAYQLLSQISEVPLADVVDANYSVVTKVANASPKPMPTATSTPTSATWLRLSDSREGRY